MLQDSNPILKENFQRTEDVWYWFKQKAEDFVTATQLSG